MLPLLEMYFWLMLWFEAYVGSFDGPKEVMKGNSAANLGTMQP